MSYFFFKRAHHLDHLKKFQPSTRLEIAAVSQNVFSLPQSLWSFAWTPPITLAQGEINVQDGTDNMKASILDQTQPAGQRPTVFRLAGSGAPDLAQKLIEAIKAALKNDSFEKVLSPNREFAV